MSAEKDTFGLVDELVVDLRARLDKYNDEMAVASLSELCIELSKSGDLRIFDSDRDIECVISLDKLRTPSCPDSDYYEMFRLGEASDDFRVCGKIVKVG